MTWAKTTAIVLAAGEGKRMNSDKAKQYLKLDDRPMIYYSLKAFEDSQVNEIILVTRASDIEMCKNIIVSYNLKKVISIVEGGKERYESVYRGLKAIEKTDYVLIHDGARPFISKDLIKKTIEAVKQYNACLVGVPVKDTIKIINNNDFIEETPDRKQLWAAQTPQAFDFTSIKEAYESLIQEGYAKREKMTDDAMVYEEYLKRPVKMICGSYRNLKVTTEEDYILAKAIFKDYCV